MYLGSIFIPEKYVFSVCFESPFMRMISSLKYMWPPGPVFIKIVPIFKFKNVKKSGRPDFWNFLQEQNICQK